MHRSNTFYINQEIVQLETPRFYYMMIADLCMCIYLATFFLRLNKPNCLLWVENCLVTFSLEVCQLTYYDDHYELFIDHLRRSTVQVS